MSLTVHYFINTNLTKEKPRKPLELCFKHAMDYAKTDGEVISLAYFDPKINCSVCLEVKKEPPRYSFERV